MGRSPTSTMGLGRTLVSSARRGPSPPARITGCMGSGGPLFRASGGPLPGERAGGRGVVSLEKHRIGTRCWQAPRRLRLMRRSRLDRVVGRAYRSRSFFTGRDPLTAPRVVTQLIRPRTPGRQKRPMPETFQNLIGGRWIPARSGRTFHNLDPATGEVLGEFPDSDAVDIQDAVDAAEKARRGWVLTPAPKRAEIVFRVGALIARNKEELARAMTREMGKVLAETRGDVQEGVDMAYFAAGEGRRLYGVTTPSEMPDKWAMSMRVPVGVVGAITPWNFPFAIPTWKLMPALVAGNVCVLKPAEDTPEMAWRLAKLFEEAGLPAGVLNVVFGDGPKAGAPLVAHPGI